MAEPTLGQLRPQSHWSPHQEEVILTPPHLAPGLWTPLEGASGSDHRRKASDGPAAQCSKRETEGPTQIKEQEGPIQPPRAKQEIRKQGRERPPPALESGSLGGTAV